MEALESAILVFGIVWIMLIICGIVLGIVPMCLVFKKAGYSWWKGIIPIYNTFVYSKCVTGGYLCSWLIVVSSIVYAAGTGVHSGGALAQIFLSLTFCVQMITSIYMMVMLCKSFGRSTAFAVGMVLLPFIFLPILGYGKSNYIGEYYGTDYNTVYSTDNTNNYM